MKCHFDCIGTAVGKCDLVCTWLDLVSPWDSCSTGPDLRAAPWLVSHSGESCFSWGQENNTWAFSRRMLESRSERDDGLSLYSEDEVVIELIMGTI